jgi:hypothetical protein
MSQEDVSRSPYCVRDGVGEEPQVGVGGRLTFGEEGA